MKKIVIVAPAPIRGSGGVGRIYHFAHALGQAGYDSHVLVFDGGDKSADDLSREARDFYGSERFTCHASSDAFHDVIDLVIATRWDTPAMSKRLVRSHKQAYLVQDYEAYFHSVGDGSLFAENSYLLGFQPITYGRWLAQKLMSEFGNAPYFMDFGSNLDAFRCETPMSHRLAGPPSIAFVYQDNKTRRCPRLGIEALGIVKHYRPDAKIYFVGSDQAPHLWYDIENVGNLTVAELNALYNTVQVGVSLSSSNPSCNSFDMMAAGLPSVDIYRENNLFDVPGGGVLLAHQTQESIAEAILHLLDNPKELLERSAFGLDFMTRRPQANEVSDFLAAIDGILNDGEGSVSTAQLSGAAHDQLPVVAAIDRNRFTEAYLAKQRQALNDVLPPVEHGQFYYPSRVSYVQKTASGQADAAASRRAAIYARLGRRLIHRNGLDARLSTRLFDPAYYLEAYRDVAAAGMDPFSHFVRYGMREGRSPSRLFDSSWYAGRYGEVAGSGMTPIEHYLFTGSALDYSPNAAFDSRWYLARYPDIKAAGLHPVSHFFDHGEAERRDPSGVFSTAWYVANNPDVAAAGSSPLMHYISAGAAEGRLALPPSRAAGFGRPALGTGDASIFDWHPAPEDFEPKAPRKEVDVLTDEQMRKQVTFDVWSTIIHRRCHPDEIKLRSARLLLLHAWNDVRPDMRSTITLMEARMRAENASAPNNDYEYNFADAIEGWLEVALVPAATVKTRATLKADILAHELRAESESVELDPNISALIRKLKTPPIFISDFYMGASFLRDLLGNTGIGRHFGDGYASCDHFKNKRSGVLFGHVMDARKLAPSDIVHIGDNFVSDVERPTALGIDGVHYVSEADQERDGWYTRAFHALCLKDPSVHYRRMLALVEDLAAAPPASYDAEQRALYDLGCRIGVLGFGYSLNVMQDAITQKAEQVAFFAREGILFQQIYDAVAAADPFSTPAPPSKLLYVSRRATFAASLRTFDADELMRLWTMYWQQSPAAFANSLNLDRKKAAQAAANVGLDFTTVVSAPWQDAGFLAFMQDEAFAKYVAQSVAKQRGDLEAYLAQELGSFKELFIADIGWRGTIQDNVAHLTGVPVRGHYLALFKYLNEQPDGSSKVAWLSDLNQPGDYEMPDQVGPIEMIFNGPGGSTTGYRKTAEGRVEPIREIFPGEEAVVDALAPCRAGMLAVAPVLANYVKLHGLLASDLRDLNRQVVTDFLTRPPAVIADIFQRLEHNETFGVGEVKSMGEAGFGDLIKLAPGAELHAALSSWLGSGWQAGASRQTVVQDWWAGASVAARASAPLPILRAQTDIVAKAQTTRIAIYVSGDQNSAEAHQNIANAVRALCGIGFEVELRFDQAGPALHAIESRISDTKVPTFTSWASGGSHALAFATDAASASHIAVQGHAEFTAYLMHEDDVVLRPTNTLSLASETRHVGLRHFTYSQGLAKAIQTHFGVATYPVGRGIDADVYSVQHGIERGRSICMVYEPANGRRANELALEALSLVSRQQPGVKIYLFGSHDAPAVDFEIEHLGVLPEGHARNALYNRCRVGICLNLGVPSRVNFEMAAAGCVAVDIYRQNNLLDQIDGAAVLAFQSPASLAKAVGEVLNRPWDDGDAPALASKVAARTLSWERDSFVANVLAVLDRTSPSGEQSVPVYVGPAVVAASDEEAGVLDFCARQLELAKR